jgi:N-acetylglutamate synthase-like GNAT family acetyltransferase
MDSSVLKVRRATVDDLETLKSLWDSMRLLPETLESRLMEFQVVENGDGQVLGAIGVQFFKQHALLHSEGYSDFGIADAARQLFWERLQTLAANHGIFRVWTQERLPFWKNFGFAPPTPEVMNRLPDPWQNEFGGAWLTFQLKNEEVINAALEKNFAHFMADEKSKSDQLAEKAHTLKLIITIAGFAIGIGGIALATWMFFHRHPLAPQ